MKIYNYIIAAAFALMCFASCEEDDVDNRDFSTRMYFRGENPMKIDLAYTAEGVMVEGGVDSLNVWINKLAEKDEILTIKAVSDEALINQFNELNGTEYKLLPEAHYTLTNTELTIPTGKIKSEDYAYITISDENLLALDHKAVYLLPISLEHKEGKMNPAGSQAVKYVILNLTKILVEPTNQALPGAALDRSNWGIEASTYAAMASNLVNGLITDRWYCRTSDQGSITIDLKEEQSITGISTSPYYSSYSTGYIQTNYVPGIIMVELSNDETNWQSLGSVDFSPYRNEVFATSTADPYDLNILFYEVQTARYVRITILSSMNAYTWVGLSELNIYTN